MPENDDELSFAVDLAWDFVQKVREGEQPSRTKYLARLPDEKNRERFNFLVNMDDLAQNFANIQADLELKDSPSDLPKDGPDIVQG